MEETRGKLVIGELLLEPSLDQISRGSQRGNLRPQVTELLLFLAARPGEVVSSDSLLSALWQGKVVSDGTVYNCVAELRQAIAALDDSQPYIETIPKRGYRLVTPVVNAVDGQPPALEQSRPYPLQRRPISKRPLILLAALSLLGLALFIAPGFQSKVPREPGNEASPLQRFTIELPREIAEFSAEHRPVLISPNGRRIIVPGGVEDEAQLYFRSIEEIAVHPIAGTVGADNVFALSPDGEWIAFTLQGDNRLLKVRSTGGVPVTLCETAGRVWSLSWNHPDSIVLVSGAYDGLMRVSAQGGTPQPITFPLSGEVHKHPYMLRTGKAVVFTIGSRGVTMRERDQLAVLSLKTGKVTRLIPGASPSVTLNGLLVYFRSDVLWAARFDEERLEVTGASVPVADDVHYDTVAHFSLSDEGTIVYVINSNFTPRQLVWVDRDGRESPLPLAPRPYLTPRLSPDGDQVAVVVDSPGGADLWIYALDDSLRTRLTADESREASPVWQRDGAAVFYSSERVDNLYVRRADGTGTAVRLTMGPRYDYAYSTSPDGRELLFTRVASQVLPGSPGEMIALDLETLSERSLVKAESLAAFEPTVSPDGRLLAYSALRAGRREVYVRKFDEPESANWMISQGGGSQPMWDADGDELFFRGSDAIMLVGIEADGKPATKPTPILKLEDYVPYDIRNYDLTKDGRRLLMVKNHEDALPLNQVVLTQHWAAHVERELLNYEAGK